MASKTFRGVSLHNNERGNSRGLEGEKGACKSNSAKVASTENGKYIVVCRMLLSHKRKISFRWVFSHALPTMAGREYTTRVKAIMTDGGGAGPCH
eukprot:scaffold11726_cov107-Amphora_coffeaeformis.AAC.1